MIVVADSITRNEAIELGEIKILLEFLFELSSKSKRMRKWGNDEDIVANGGPGASSMKCKHPAKQGEELQNVPFRRRRPVDRLCCMQSYEPDTGSH